MQEEVLPDPIYLCISFACIVVCQELDWCGVFNVIVVEVVEGWKDVGGIVVIVEVSAVVVVDVVGVVDVEVIVDNIVVVVVGDVVVVIWFFCIKWWC